MTVSNIRLSIFGVTCALIGLISGAYSQGVEQAGVTLVELRILPEKFSDRLISVSGVLGYSSYSDEYALYFDLESATHTVTSHGLELYGLRDSTVVAGNLDELVGTYIIVGGRFEEFEVYRGRLRPIGFMNEVSFVRVYTAPEKPKIHEG